MAEDGFTVVRVKRKKEDDPDKGLRVDLKRRKIDVKFSYAGTVASKDAEDAIALVTPSRKRKNPTSLDEVSAVKEKVYVF
ncbi:Oidioi.mRNA.OKI2018_I69.chr1.g3039.t1.cds [Oikopleura dioica]|uniref:Oidioi.mRNA.OKI2018_I69.chr1.g3039.t1.cds n=1 Tax=Oikopleura dioica TaxID=34765 RepID=A0ABN7SWG7_OIKDI|nr:Oidioi.mRNA.OKI2018_I69.chr1.g3039.t1.cds [Oikopleura dioica]